MAAAPSKPPSRKLLDRRKLFGWPLGACSTALVATTFCLLLLVCSLFFLDMEIVYRKTGFTSQFVDPAVVQLNDGLANSTTQVPTPAMEKVITSSNTNSTDLLDTETRAETKVQDGDDVASSEALEVPVEKETVLPTTTEPEVETLPSEETSMSMSTETETVSRDVEIVEEFYMAQKKRSLEGCDITQGRWVFDNVTYPLYRTKNCPFADPGFRCEDNGRPDKEFMSYHWQPHDCELPRFNATDILERLRGQRMVFVGDSLGRNTWESMLCMLAEGVADKTSIYEVNGEPITKHSGKLIYRFKDFNCTVEYYREPFLVVQGRPPKNSPANVTCALRLDTVSWSTGSWIDADIIIFNVGHWWTEHKIFRQGCKFQEDGKLKNYDLPTGLGKALLTWAQHLEKHLDSKKTQLFWLSFPTVHFRGGSWNRGGHCHQERRPLTEEEARNEWQTPWMNQIVQDKFMANIKQKLESVTYLDITTATNYRPDGHGALYTWDTKKYGLKPRNHQDCSHFCLPGVPEAWNELVLGSLFAKGKRTWARPL